MPELRKNLFIPELRVHKLKSWRFPLKFWYRCFWLLTVKHYSRFSNPSRTFLFPRPCVAVADDFNNVCSRFLVPRPEPCYCLSYYLKFIFKVENVLNKKSGRGIHLHNAILRQNTTCFLNSNNIAAPLFFCSQSPFQVLYKS